MTTSIQFDCQSWLTLNDDAREKQAIVHGNRLRLLQLDEGFQESDWCHKVHYGYVVEGQLQLQFSDRTENLSPGDEIALPEGKSFAHKAVVVKGPVTLFLVEPAPSPIDES